MGLRLRKVQRVSSGHTESERRTTALPTICWSWSTWDKTRYFKIHHTTTHTSIFASSQWTHQALLWESLKIKYSARFVSGGQALDTDVKMFKCSSVAWEWRNGCPWWLTQNVLFGNTLRNTTFAIKISTVLLQNNQLQQELLGTFFFTSLVWM